MAPNATTANMTRSKTAGFVIALFAISEGREAWQGELVCDDHCEDSARTRELNRVG